MVEQQTRAAAKHRRAERLSRIAALRLAGVSDQTSIARELGVSQSTVSRLFAKLDQQYLARAGEDTATLKGQQYERCEAMLGTVWQAARGGDLAAIDRVERFLRREAELMGLDAPKRQELTGENAGPIQFTIRLGDVEPPGAVAEA
jgi:hypothetical protein